VAQEWKGDSSAKADADSESANPVRGEPRSESMPIYVDLDGTLISSDMLWETLWILLRERPAVLLQLPFWLLRGKSRFKETISSRVAFDASLLPFRPEVLDYLNEEKAHGRRIVLATASNRRIADAIATHLGIFDSVLASDRDRNLRGDEKCRAILADCSESDFEYLGDSTMDLPIWRSASVATLVAASPATVAEVRRLPARLEIIEIAKLDPWPALRAMRSYQWVKNALLFVPILLAHEISDLSRTLSVFVAFATFCAVASATYMLNDLLDIESDRQHVRKRSRPFASGSLPIPTGVWIAGGLLLAGFITSSLLLPAVSTGMLAIYTVLTVSYSFRIKELLFIDVLMLAGLYTHRVLAGAVAASVVVSPWLLAFSLFFFLSLALLKRYSELLALQDREGESLARRAYTLDDLGLVETMGTSSGFMSVLILCLFVLSDDVSQLYPTPELLWLVCPIFLYWIARMWFLARHRILSDDPVLFAATDRVSYFVGALIGFVGILAAFQR
jgi:4-hydroxybenzoate polyprenyltransferase/phosphoserine phosphatase